MISGVFLSVICCVEVGVVDFVCFCKLFLGNSYLDVYVINVFLVLSKCGGVVEVKFKGRNCVGMWWI